MFKPRTLSLAALALSLAMVSSSPALADSGRRGDARHRGFQLELPPAPVLAGDGLTLHARRAISRRFVERLRVRIGGVPADFYRVDRHTLRILVPPGVSGSVPVRVVEKRRRHRRVLLRERVELAATDIRTDGPAESGQEFGLFFVEASSLRVGSVVEGWVRAEGVATSKTTAPVSVTGTITATAGPIIDLLLTGTDSPERDAPPPVVQDPRITVLDDVTLQLRIDLDTGAATGTISSPDRSFPIEDDVVVAGVTPPKGTPPAPKIAGIEPRTPRPGGVVKIFGAGFGDVQGRNRVVLGGRPVTAFPRVESWQDDVIVVQLPFFVTGPYDLIVTNDLVPSLQVDLKVDPPCPNPKPFSATIEVGASATANAVVALPDCGFVVAGSTTTSKGDTDALLLRTDSEGNVLWQRVFGGEGFDEANDVEVLHHGFLLVGETGSTELDAQGRDALVMRVSHEGIPVWTRVLGTPADEIAHGVTVHHEHNSLSPSRVAVVGSTTESDAEKGMDGLVYLMTTDGEVLAQRAIAAEADDRLDDVVATGRQGFVAVGRTRSESLGAKDGFDPLVLSMDANGAVLDIRAFPVSGGDDFASSVESTTRGTFAIAGQSRTTVSRDDGFGPEGSLFVLEVDDAGNRIATREFDGRGQDVGVAGGFPDGDGGVVLAAFTDSSDFGAGSLDPLLVKLSCQGTALDTRRPGASAGVERIFDAARLQGDHFVVAGHVVAGGGNKILLATEAAFADDAPRIERFTGNEDTAARVRQGDPLTLRWRVHNADALQIERLDTNGPDLDLQLAGGDLVDETLTFDSFSLNGAERCESEGSCGDAVYRLTATTECATVEANVVVTVMPVTSNLSANEERLLEIESMVIQRFDQPNGGSMGDLVIARAVEECDANGNCSLVARLFAGSHPDTTAFPPQNICIGQSGFPYANPGAAGAAATGTIDDAEPALLSYANDGSIASWSYGRLLFNRGETTPPAGLPIPDSAWFGHYSGWHTGDGGMTIWGVDGTFDTPFGPVPEPPPIGPACNAPPEFGGGPRADFCGASPQPLIFHPSAWDTHFFRDLDGGGLIRVGRFASEVDLSDPCVGAPIVGNDCETGTDPLTVPGTNDGVSLFPFIDFETGTFIPTPCGG